MAQTHPLPGDMPRQAPNIQVHEGTPRGEGDIGDDLVDAWFPATKLDCFWVPIDSDLGKEVVQVLSLNVAYAPDDRRYTDVNWACGVPTKYLDGWKKEKTRLKQTIRYSAEGQPIFASGVTPACEFFTSHLPQGWSKSDFAPILRELGPLIEREKQVKAYERGAIVARNAQASRTAAVNSSPNDALAKSIAEGLAVALQNLGLAQPKKA